VAVEDLKELAEVFADPNKKVMSLWTMGVNQHNRGTWMNHCIYNVHLLSGKIAQPGCGPFSLTGQPTACGTAREVGTFSHRLPADLLVANEQHRRYTEAIWDLPQGYLDEIKVCTGYEIDGKVTTDFPVPALLDRAKPVYETLPGWKCDIRGVTDYGKLPQAARDYVDFIEKHIEAPITIVSTGPKRHEICRRAGS